MQKAVFLDRDGVLNELVLNPSTGEYEPPHTPEDLRILPDVIGSLKILQGAGFELFLVSNQPDYAKGKTTLEGIHAVNTRFNQIMTLEGIHFRGYYFCFHHPDGIVPEYSFSCECRKPSPFFLLKAASKYHIDLIRSWMIGDRDSDIECGKAAGTRTIIIEEPHSAGSRGSSSPDYTTANLQEAATIIICHSNLI